MTTMYTAYLDGRQFSGDDDRDAIVAYAKKLFEDAAADTPATVTVVDEHGKLIHWQTNRRIEGIFDKQIWGGRKGDDAISQGTERFDATELILLMGIQEIRELDDNDDSSDELGRQLIAWAGPCSVSVIQSMLLFFGELDADDITEEHLALARAEHAPVPREDCLVEVTVKLKIRKTQGQSIQEILNELDYSFTSTIPGTAVLDTEIKESKLIQT